MALPALRSPPASPTLRQRTEEAACNLQQVALSVGRLTVAASISIQSHMNSNIARSLWVMALCMGLAAPPAWAGPVLDHIKQSGRLVIGNRDASVPFSYLDENRKPIGYAIDLCLKIAEAVRSKLGLSHLAIDYVTLTSATRIAAVAEGKVDLECESTTNNAERRQKVAFAIPHYITGARYVVRADSSLRDLSDLVGRTVVSTVGTTPLKAIAAANRERLLGMRIIEVPDHVRGIEMVEKGEADAFIMDEVLLVGLISSRPKPDQLKVIGRFLTTEALGIMFPNTDPELKQIVDSEMKRLIYSREAMAIHDRWFLQPIPPHGRSLNLRMNYLLKDFWKFPSDWVPN
jgi:ABC-type amino acid transport substrate-binding protein